MHNILIDSLPILTLFVAGFSIGGIIRLHSIVAFGDFTRMVIELLGAFTVTFLGLYASNIYSKKQDYENKKRESNNYYKSALVLISSELDFNEKILLHLIDGINSMPKLLKTYHSQFSFLIEVAKPIKSNAFYATFYTQSIHEIINNLELFNALQQAYYNIELAVNGLYLSRDAHTECIKMPEELITSDILENSNMMIVGDKNKIIRAIELLRKAKNVSDTELDKYNLKFTQIN